MSTKVHKCVPTGPDSLKRVTRRGFLAGSAGAGLAASWPLILTPGKARAAQHEVNIAFGGGRSSEIAGEVWAKPFTEETGIQANMVEGGRTLSDFKSMVLTGNYKYDVFAKGGSQAIIAQSEELLERIPGDFNMPAMTDPAWEEYESVVAFLAYGNGIGYDPMRNATAPKTWPEFWDTEKFPGRRSLWANAEEMLEAALCADGADPKNLYPLDVDRAFRSLEKIKDNIAVWIVQHSRSIQLMQNAEVDFSVTYTGRVYRAQAEGVSLAVNKEAGIAQPSFWGVVKGAPNKEAAWKFIEFATRPENIAAYVEKGGNQPTVKAAIPLLSADAKSKTIDFTLPNVVSMSLPWWAENFEEMSKRYKDFLSG